MSTLPFLTQAEIDQICEPLRVPGYQVKYLTKLGLVVHRKPNGRPLVARGEFERVLVGRQDPSAQNAATGQPDRAALPQVIQGDRRGAKAQGQ